MSTTTSMDEGDNVAPGSVKATARENGTEGGTSATTSRFKPWADASPDGRKQRGLGGEAASEGEEKVWRSLLAEVRHVSRFMRTGRFRRMSPIRAALSKYYPDEFIQLHTGMLAPSSGDEEESVTRGDFLRFISVLFSMCFYNASWSTVYSFAARPELHLVGDIATVLPQTKFGDIIGRLRSFSDADNLTCEEKPFSDSSVCLTPLEDMLSKCGAGIAPDGFYSAIDDFSGKSSSSGKRTTHAKVKAERSAHGTVCRSIVSALGIVLAVRHERRGESLDEGVDYLLANCGKAGNAKHGLVASHSGYCFDKSLEADGEALEAAKLNIVAARLWNMVMGNADVANILGIAGQLSGSASLSSQQCVTVKLFLLHAVSAYRIWQAVTFASDLELLAARESAQELSPAVARACALHMMRKTSFLTWLVTVAAPELLEMAKVADVQSRTIGVANNVAKSAQTQCPPKNVVAGTTARNKKVANVDAGVNSSAQGVPNSDAGPEVKEEANEDEILKKGPPKRRRKSKILEDANLEEGRFKRLNGKHLCLPLNPPTEVGADRTHQRRCVLCSKKTTKYCFQCNVVLCNAVPLNAPSEDRTGATCFYKYHSEETVREVQRAGSKRRRVVTRPVEQATKAAKEKS